MRTTIGDMLKMAGVQHLREVLEACSEAVIVCHLTPDGDAIGSSLAMSALLRDMGKRTHVVTPDAPPKNLMWLPGAREIMPYSRFEKPVAELFEKADLICCLDFNAPKRIDRVSPLLESTQAKKVLIDHHLDPEDFADVKISRPEYSSTCILLYDVICQMGWRSRITRRIGECLYTGMMTDTGNFTYNSCHPDLYKAIAHFVSLGVDKDKIYNQVCNSNSVNKLRLNGYATYEKMEVYEEHRCALITLTQEELNRFNYERGDTEGLVNVPLSVPEMVYSIFLREESAYVKVSTRSRGDFPVNKMCEEHFNGGGHKNAAGGEFFGTMQEAIDKVREVMPLYDPYLPAPATKNEQNKNNPTP